VCVFQESRIYAVAKSGMRVSEASLGVKTLGRGQSTNQQSSPITQFRSVTSTCYNTIWTHALRSVN